jgi:hypothetical protein
MIKKRVKNIGKIGILIGIRQTYFLARNWYLLWREPEETLGKIWETKDKSQMFLVAISAWTPMIIYFLAKTSWDLIRHGRLLDMWGGTFLATMAVQLAVFGYLGYWMVKIGRKSNV